MPSPIDWITRSRGRFVGSQIALGAAFGTMVGIALGHQQYLDAALTTAGSLGLWRWMVARRRCAKG